MRIENNLSNKQYISNDLAIKIKENSKIQKASDTIKNESEIKVKENTKVEKEIRSAKVDVKNFINKAKESSKAKIIESKDEAKEVLKTIKRDEIDKEDLKIHDKLSLDINSVMSILK